MLTRSTVYRASLEALVIYTLVFCMFFLLYLYDYFLLVFNIDTLLYGYKLLQPVGSPCMENDTDPGEHSAFVQ